MWGWGYWFPLSKDVLAFRSLGDFNNNKKNKAFTNCERKGQIKV